MERTLSLSSEKLPIRRGYGEKMRFPTSDFASQYTPSEVGDTTQILRKTD